MGTQLMIDSSSARGSAAAPGAPIEERKSLIWRCSMSCWKDRRICSANSGLPPAVKRQISYDSVALTAWPAYPLCEPGIFPVSG